MVERTSIIDEIRNGKYDASIITTFNAYFPFYENVVLKHLLASGCQYNLLLMDAAEYQVNLANPNLRPRFAGKHYSLFSVVAGKVFHPKIVLLIGKDKSLLLVGSHNLTIAGYSNNREITSKFEWVKNNENNDTLTIFQTVWQFIKKWLENLPEQVSITLKDIESSASWLQDSVDTSASAKDMFFGTLPEGISLWEQIKPKLPKNAKRAFVIGPFFDSKLDFLKLLQEELFPTELIVGIDPETVSISGESKDVFPEASFVNASSLCSAEDNSTSMGYLHAKAIMIDSEDNNVFLITGSANPTKAAWLGAGDQRNAEAIICRTNVKGSFGDLENDLRDLINKPKISDDDWKSIKNIKKDSYSVISSLSIAVIAVATEKSVEIWLNYLIKENNINKIAFFNSNNEEVWSSTTLSSPNDQGQLILDVNVTPEWSFFVIYFADENQIFGIIHHENELQNLAKTDRQKTLERAINSLYSSSPLLEEVVSLIWKIVFDEIPQNFQGNTLTKPSEEKNKVEVLQSSFVADLNENTNQKNRTSRIASRELSALLDILICHLGRNLDKPDISEPDFPLESEEDLIGSEEETDYQKKAINEHTDIDLYQKKIKSLLNKMINQAKAAFEDNTRCSMVILQMAAILALVNRLCLLNENNTSWIPKGKLLIQKDSLLSFLSKIIPPLYHKDKGIISFAKSNIYQGNFEEITFIRSFLLWLAWYCGLNIEFPINKKEFKISNKDLIGWKRLACVVLDNVDDNQVCDRAVNLINHSNNDDLKQTEEWFEKSMNWAKKIQTNMHKQNSNPINTKPLVPGDVVVRNNLPDSPLYVVLENGITKIQLSFLDNDDEKGFKPEKLVKIGSVSNSPFAYLKNEKAAAKLKKWNS